MARPIVFLKLAWMHFYDGRAGDDPRRTMKHVKKTGKGHEDLNFRKINGWYYGYAPIAGGDSGLDIANLGAGRGDVSMQHVDVVFISSAPGNTGVFVLGWYLDAMVYRDIQVRQGSRSYIVKSQRAHLVDRDDRWFRITNGPRRGNNWYAKDRPQLVARVRAYIQSGGAVQHKPISSKAKRDRDRALVVEHNAYDVVMEKFSKEGYEVAPVWLKNRGWDLEARRGKQVLYIEVKGRSGSDLVAELTPKEYKKSSVPGYRICIVPAALNAKPDVYTFAKNAAGIWWEERRRLRLAIVECPGARISAY